MSELAKIRETAALSGWLSQTPSDFRSMVLERTTLRTIKAGDAVHFEGDEPGGMHGLVCGMIRVETTAADHGPYFTHLVRPVTWLGEGTTIAGVPRVLTMATTRDSTLLHLSGQAVQAIATSDETYWRHFIVPLLGHFRVAVGANADLLLRAHDKRIAAVLLRLAGCRDATPPAFASAEIDATQDELARMANVSRLTAGSVLRKLEDEGVVEQAYRRVVILKPEALRGILTA